MKTVSVRLHLLPCHAAEIEAAPGCLDALGDLAAFLCRLQKLRHFGKTSAVAVMGGILPALMQHHDIRYRQRVPREVRRTIHIEPGVDAFQIVLRRQRRFIDQLVVFRLYGKAVAVDAVQRLKAIIQRFIAALELVDGEATHRFVPRRPRLLHDSSGGLHIGGRLRRVLPFRLFRRGQHFIHTGSVRILQGRLDLGRVEVQELLVARGVLELFDLGGKIVLLGLAQRRQLFIQSGDAPGHQIFIKRFLCGVRLRVLRRVLRIVLTEELVHIKGDIHGPLGFFFFGKIVLEGHHPVFVGDAAALTIVILAEAVPRIPHIALIRKAAVFVHRHVPAVGLIVDVILQVLRHLHDLQLINVIAPKIIIVLNMGIDLIAVQIFRQVDDFLQAAAMVAHFHTGLKLRVFAVAHFIQLRRQIVELVQIFVFAQLVIEAVHIAVIVCDEPFLIGLAEVIPLADADTLEYLLHFLGGGGELHPLAHKLALVVLAKIGDKGGKGIVLVVTIIRHIRSSFSFAYFWEIPA